MACALLLSSVGNGFALDYVALNVALNESGVQLYIILHSTATLFACIIAVLLAQARHPRPMGGGHQKPSEANGWRSSEAIRGQWVAVIRSHQKPIGGGHQKPSEAV